MPRFRFTVRRIMVAVAITAGFLWVQRWIDWRSSCFWTIACHHSRLTYPDNVNTGLENWTRTPKNRHHFAMSLKYDRAARYPWLPVAPDRPEPE